MKNRVVLFMNFVARINYLRNHSFIFFIVKDIINIYLFRRNYYGLFKKFDVYISQFMINICLVYFFFLCKTFGGVRFLHFSIFIAPFLKKII